ncbi:CHAP domain-containing protein [Streptomyces sp. NPDC006208]|uniref:CHAP domain-containing protein n=1 Tax=Streptomyces sp. NPDC006208 TaxID=3156734 RepID=UPI0033A53422
MYDTTSSIRLARSQTGYREGRSANGRWNNNQKYSVQLPDFSWSNWQPWCATFVQWVFWQTGVTVPVGARSASCGVSCAAYKKAGRFTAYPVVGAQVFYGANGSNHTGIVVRFDDTYVYTVEGNTNSSGSAEGDGVHEKKRVRRDDYVYGYGIPYYKGKAVSPDPKWNEREMST